MLPSVGTRTRDAMVARAIVLSYSADMSVFTPLPPSPPEAALIAAEQALGVTITVRDLTGWLRRPDGVSMLDTERNSHRRQPVCLIGFTQACVQHCRHDCSQALRQSGVVHATRCWKGVREVLTPVIRNGSLQGYLFAGAWRDGPRPEGSWAEAWQQLPLWDAALAARVGSVLALLADGLWCLAELERAAPLPGDRAGRIRSFIRANPGRGRIGLARHLGLSPSRTSHLVQELFGKSLQELVIDERLAAAQRLLADTDLAVAEIGNRVGWGDPPHFARIFRRRTAWSPAAWRSQHRRV